MKMKQQVEGMYLPLAKHREMQFEEMDWRSEDAQRRAWEVLKATIHGLVNRVGASNVLAIAHCLRRENLVRGRGLLCKAVMKAQAASPEMSNVYAALISSVNCQFPEVGSLLLNRLVLRFRRSIRRKDNKACLTTSTFIAQLVNQQVVYDVLALEILTSLLISRNVTNDTVEIAVNFVKQCGQKLSQTSPTGLYAVFDCLRRVLSEVELEDRVIHATEAAFQERKEGFKNFPILSQIGLIEEIGKDIHYVSLHDKNLDPDHSSNVFQFDPLYEESRDLRNMQLSNDSYVCFGLCDLKLKIVRLK